MRRGATVVVAVACLAAGTLAGEVGPPAPGESKPPAARVRYRLWATPFYVVVGLPRDLIDAPSKGLSSIPIFNRVFIAPLAMLNTLTAVISWSFTKDGMEGGFEAWIDCLEMPRKEGAHMPESMVDRPWWKNYFPNLRTFVIIRQEPEPQ